MVFTKGRVLTAVVFWFMIFLVNAAVNAAYAIKWFLLETQREVLFVEWVNTGSLTLIITTSVVAVITLIVFLIPK